MAFFYCRSMTLIVIPKSVKYLQGNAFADCPDLKINCEASHKPYMWSLEWNSGELPVKWGVE